MKTEGIYDVEPEASSKRQQNCNRRLKSRCFDLDVVGLVPKTGD